MNAKERRWAWGPATKWAQAHASRTVGPFHLQVLSKLHVLEHGPSPLGAKTSTKHLIRTHVIRHVLKNKNKNCKYTCFEIALDIIGI